MRRLVAAVLCLAACGSGSVYPTAAPALVRAEPAEDVMAQMAPVAPVSQTVTGVITFGVAYDLDTLDIPKPLTRFKRTYPVIAWSADLARGVDAAFVSWVVLRRSELGDETVFDVEEPIDDSSVTTLANSGDLAHHVHNVPGTYVMRYIDSREVLAEGTFTLVE